eukprot:453064_1
MSTSCYRRFLRGCNNFNTNKDNLLLLLYGYINRETNNSVIYKNVPNELIWYFIGFVFDITKLTDIESQWHTLSAPKSIIFGKHKLKHNIVRKLWRIKATSTKHMLSFKIGIGTGSDCDKHWLFIKNGLIKGTNIKFQNNDIISILYLRTKHAILRFAINGNECLKIDGKCFTGCKIWIQLYHQTNLQILNDCLRRPLPLK